MPLLLILLSRDADEMKMYLVDVSEAIFTFKKHRCAIVYII